MCIITSSNEILEKASDKTNQFTKFSIFLSQKKKN